MQFFRWISCIFHFFVVSLHRETNNVHMRMIATLAEIQKFLNDFHQKVEVFDILFWDERDKNNDTLHQLQITANERKDIVKTITPEDYSEGPIRTCSIVSAIYGYSERTLRDKRCISKYVTGYLIARQFVYRFM